MSRGQRIASTALLASRTSPSGNMNTVSEARWVWSFREDSSCITTPGEVGGMEYAVSIS